MKNKEIARLFKELTALMEYHHENTFKIRSYRKFYDTVRKMDTPISSLSEKEMTELPGVGKAIAAKIMEIKDSGSFSTLERFRKQTPEGIQQLLTIRGLGAKKLKALIDHLDIQNPGELLYACHENRLIEVKGFGAKSQEKIKEAIEFWQGAQGKYLYREALEVHNTFVSQFQDMSDPPVRVCGDVARKLPIVESIDYLCCIELKDLVLDQFSVQEESKDKSLLEDDKGHRITLLHIPKDDWAEQEIMRNSSPAFAQAILNTTDIKKHNSEKEILSAAGLPYIPPEYRENEDLNSYDISRIANLIDTDHIRGAVHNHSTWSDGSATLRDMAQACLDRGYQYLGISDHSKSAFYANGLQIERVIAQWKEIDAINNEMKDDGFKIFKGIESDILNDGSLDYPDEILEGFDFIVASIHSQLRMTKEKATNRLLRAIENPYTRILGHPTGRLLLSRQGYPIDHMAIIDACAEHDVVIELNANPYRLDIDWTWIPYAVEAGVMISINPDAHSQEGLGDIFYGVQAARKGGLTAKECLNALPKEEFESWCHSR